LASSASDLEFDVLVIGTGIAGLLASAELGGRARVALLSKARVGESNTRYAQGGIAAAGGPGRSVEKHGDSVEAHVGDTVAAGARFCNERAVRVLAAEGAELVEELVRFGVGFDAAEGGYALTREGGHSVRRIMHAGGDSTGEVIARALLEYVRGAGGVNAYEDRFVVDLIVEHGRCVGALALNSDTGEIERYRAGAVVLAAGGAGQIYRDTSNPPIATGDGVAMAYRAGAAVGDLEFVQFHPTTLPTDAPDRPNFLISEALRGEGAVLLNRRMERFAHRYHPDGELAPRDVVSRAIARELERCGGEHVWLDARHLGRDFLEERFPTIYRTCLDRGIDISREPVPVVPAAHYFMGGVLTDLRGRTTVEGLYACGETACTGVHGANRLAGNSLLEAVVFGRRAARDALAALEGRAPGGECPPRLERGLEADPGGIEDPMPRWDRVRFDESDRGTVLAAARDLRSLAVELIGVVRCGPGLEEALSRISGIAERLREASSGGAGGRRGGDRSLVEALEMRNMVTVAHLVTRAAFLREESRGAHYREDRPERDPDWDVRIAAIAGEKARCFEWTDAR